MSASLTQRGSRLPWAWAYLAILAVANALIHSSVNTCFALVPVFMSELDLSLEAMGLVLMTPLIVRTVASLPAGVLADRIQPRRLAAAGLFTVAVGGLIVSQSTSVATLLAGLIILSIGQTVYHPATYRIITNLFAARRRNTALGLNGSGGTLGMAAGPITVGLVMLTLGQGSWRLGYLVWVIPAFVLSVLALIIKPSTIDEDESSSYATAGEERQQQNLSSVLTHDYKSFLMLVGVRSFGVQLVSAYMTTYLRGAHAIDVEFASILFGAMPLMGILAAPIGGYLADRRGEEYALRLALFGQATALAGVAVSPSLTFLVPLVLAYGLMESSALAPSSALVAKLSSPSRRGAAYAMFALSSNLSAALAPTIGAIIAQQLSIFSIFPLAVATLLAALLMLRRMAPIQRLNRGLPERLAQEE
jgi:MFS family permease